MESQKRIRVAYEVTNFKRLPFDDWFKFFSWRLNPQGRIFLALVQYFQQHVDRMDIVLSYEMRITWPNGTLGGVIKKINRSEIDFAVHPIIMDELTTDAVDFAYPYKLDDYTFVTRKPVYKPHISGIFQMFSLSVWLTIISVLIAMPIVSYAILKRKYTFSTICIDVFAILMKQSSRIKLSSLVEKILVYSWIVGAMLLCFSYESVFLSFLSIPPLSQIKHLSDLALAVERGDYHCSSLSPSDFDRFGKNSQLEHLRIIANDIINNKLSYDSQSVIKFFRESEKQNLAFALPTKDLVLLPEYLIFISEDRFLHHMRAIMVRRGFCCKELLDSFVHKMMASGLYMQYFSEGSFYLSLRSKVLARKLFTYSETANRKITLTDVAPAFIFLLIGYFISFLILVFEIVSGRKKNSMKIHQKRKIMQVYDETPV